MERMLVRVLKVINSSLTGLSNVTESDNRAGGIAGSVTTANVAGLIKYIRLESLHLILRLLYIMFM